jgi:hypothetical protein
MPRLVRAALVLCLTGSGTAKYRVCAAAPRPLSEKELRQGIAQALASGRNQYSFDEPFHRLVRLRGRESGRLRLDENSSVALRAAWDPTDNEIIVQPGARQVPHEVAQARVARFVAFFEGRLAVTPPEWWVRGLEYDAGDLSRVTTHAAANRLPEASFIVPWWEGTSNRLSYAGPSPTTIEVVGGKVEIRQAGHRVRLSKAAFESMTPRFFAVLAPAFYPIVVGEDCYVLSYRARDEDGFRLTSVRISDGRVRWQADGWASARRTRTGQASQTAVLVVNDQQVTVFGESTFGMYSESFALKTGRMIHRFSSTGYSSGMPPPLYREQ